MQSPKELQNIYECCKKISSNDFDEDTIAKFLINIRYSELCSQNGWLREFGDLIAHGIRDRGKIQTAIKKVREKKEREESFEGKAPVGHVGFEPQEIKKEINAFLENQNFSPVGDEEINDLILCLITLAHTMLAKQKEESAPAVIGKALMVINQFQIVLAIHSLSGSIIALTVIDNKYTSENSIDELNSESFKDSPMKAVRINGKLHVTCNGKIFD